MGTLDGIAGLTGFAADFAGPSKKPFHISTPRSYLSESKSGSYDRRISGRSKGKFLRHSHLEGIAQSDRIISGRIN
jgi:hypothetical protein